MDINADLSCAMAVFGGTGDLTYRKLMPALYNLKAHKMLSDNFAVVAIGRREMNDDEYRATVYEALKKFSTSAFDEEIWGEFKNQVYYQQFDFADDGGYERLNTFLQEVDDKHGTHGNRIYYMAVTPEYFEVIVHKLNVHKMVDNVHSWQRVVIEKPFGRDLQSAIKLNKEITEVFSEKNIYRIDHYLGKEMIQNLTVIRFANALFEPVWNSKYIDNIQISSNETVGVENRGGYYENSGALRDMVQNHMLQLLTLTAMEPPANLDPESIRDEKVKVLRSLQTFTPELICTNVVRGQYGGGTMDGKAVPGYREEEKVSPLSNTETFIAMKVNVQNFRWGDVPIYIRTGKRMESKSTDVVIQFKALPHVLYFQDHTDLAPNILVIRIQPNESVYMQFNAKKPGIGNTIVPVSMDFCQNCQDCRMGNSPEAYERLLRDVMKGDSTLFTRWDEVEYSWKFVDNISAAWQEEPVVFSNYEAGSWGPEAANELLARDGRKWWNIEG